MPTAPMRILFPYLARWHSANRSRYHHLLEALARRGHRITVLQPPALPGAEETNFIEMPSSEVAGVRLEELRVPPMVWQRGFPLEKAAKKGIAALSARSEVLRRCREGTVDVLVLYHLAHTPLIRARARTVLVDLADDLLAMLREELPAGLRPAVTPVAKRLLRRLISRAHLVTTPSAVLARRLGGARVVPNGVDREAIRAADPRRIRARYTSPIVGFVGAFEYFVDFAFVLEAAARLPGCTFLLVGGGRGLKAVREAAGRRGLANVHLPGPVPYAEALDYMASFDVALLPFRRGAVADASSPLKLFEYLALGKPVFSTPMTEVHHIAGPWIQEGASVEACVEFIDRIAKGWPDEMRRAAAGQAAVLERFAWDRIAAELEALLAQVQAR